MLPTHWLIFKGKQIRWYWHQMTSPWSHTLCGDWFLDYKCVTHRRVDLGLARGRAGRTALVVEMVILSQQMVSASHQPGGRSNLSSQCPLRADALRASELCLETLLGCKRVVARSPGARSAQTQSPEHVGGETKGVGALLLWEPRTRSLQPSHLPKELLL